MNFKKYFSQSTSIAFTACLLLMTGCGGGGGSEDDANQTTPSDQITWTQGTFEDAGNFKNACATPRTGTDSQGNRFPDKAGSILQENHWLRSWSNETYLWYDEIPDRNPANFNSTAAYFEVLKSSQLSPAGNPKDKFHFTYDTEVWQKLTQSDESAGYGAELIIQSRTPPRKLVVGYTVPGTPAATNNNLMRGTEILTIDGVDFVNANDQQSVDKINAALFPSKSGETHTFEVKDYGATQSRTITMTSQTISESPVHTVTTLNTANKKVGYIMFNAHRPSAEKQLVDGVNELISQNVDDLILDLRYNGGGYLRIAAQMGYMIAGSTQTNNKTFYNSIFNDKHTSVNPVTNQPLTPVGFTNQTVGLSLTAGAALPSLNLNRVFILSTSDTCSASEAIINGLRGIDVEVILIGSTSCGKPYGFYPTDNCGTTYFTIQFKGTNEKGFGDYSDGFSPVNTTTNQGAFVTGCVVEDDFSKTTDNPQEKMTAAALNYIETGSCPTATVIAQKEPMILGTQSAEQLEEGIPVINPKKIKELILNN